MALSQSVRGTDNLRPLNQGPQHSTTYDTRGVLTASTTKTIAYNPSSWFLRFLALFLFPILTLAASFHFLPPAVSYAFAANFVQGYDSHTLATSAVVVYGYAILLTLVYGSIICPDFLPLHRVVETFTERRRYRRSHISNMRLDRFRRLVDDKVFTIFVTGESGPSTPISVTEHTTIADILQTLTGRSRRWSTFLRTYNLWTFGRVSHRLHGRETMRDLGAGDLSHFQLRVNFPGGTRFSDPPATPSRSSGTGSTPVLDSPSKNTRSRITVASAVLQSPTRPRRPRKGELSDDDVWDWTDEDIIKEASQHWKAATYNHYTVQIRRVEPKDGARRYIDLQFVCKHDPRSHRTQVRKRMKTSEGTNNLLRTEKACNDKRKVPRGSDSNAGAQQTLTQSISTYTPARHRALLAMRCARSRRPFNSVADPDYLAEVQLLRPGTVVPHPSTVSRDARDIYLQASNHIKEYFSKHEGSIHLVVDGWTAPFATSYLGIVVVWYAEGKIWRSILEFIRLTESHTGRYMANAIADCLRRFGLDKLFHTINMDNAANCDTTAEHLATLIEGFRGQASRCRCFPHTVNLIAKAFISFFFRQPKRKKTTPAGSQSRRTRTRGRTTADAGGSAGQGTAADAGGSAGQGTAEPDVTGEASENVDELMTSVEQAYVDAGEDAIQDDDVDEAKAAHDEMVVGGIKDKALKMAAQLGITMSKKEETMALGIFPKVAGLARRLHDTTTLGDRFTRIVQSIPDYKTQKKSLDRRVPTRWNSDFACLAAHVYFEKAVKQLIIEEDDKLEAFLLTKDQWALARQLVDVLDLFNDVTKLFSQAEVPLVYEVIPMLEDIEHRLDWLLNNPEYPPCIRIAAQAGLLVVGKYYALSDENEVYRIAIAMCPDKKIKWFGNNPDWREEDREAARQVVVDRWNETYAPPPSSGTTEASSQPLRTARSKSIWDSISRERAGPSISLNADSIDAYLESAPVSPLDVEAAGGVLKYWEQARTSRPRLARMALDFLSAPASSVDAERAFSGGRLQTNHLQHNMESQTFKAQMALGSWAGTPLMPDLTVPTNILASKIRKGKGKAEEVPTVSGTIDLTSDTMMDETD